MSANCRNTSRHQRATMQSSGQYAEDRVYYPTPAMSQAPPVAISAVMTPGGSAAASAAGSEKNATSRLSAPTSKLRSCGVCRSRKVRCDKQSPCSNCRRANIPCVFPATDRAPRWARRLDRVVNNAAANPQAAQEAGPGVNQVMERLRTLEGLVKELTGQLEQAHAAANSASGAPSAFTSPGSSTHDRDIEHQRDVSPAISTGNVQKQFGRLVLHDANRSHYVSSGFWSRVSDEVRRPAMVKSSSRPGWLTVLSIA